MNVQRSALLPYSAAQMYAVINDIRSYPEFLNWCDEVIVLDEDFNSVEAELKIAYGHLKISFATQNLLIPNESISMSLISGPFKKLSGKWLLQELGDEACKVSLAMDFTFENPITHRLFGKVFKTVVSAQVDAFRKRAEYIYDEVS